MKKPEDVENVPMPGRIVAAKHQATLINEAVCLVLRIVKGLVRRAGWRSNNSSGPRGIRVMHGKLSLRRSTCRLSGRRGERKGSLSIYPYGRCQLLIHHKGLD